VSDVELFARTLQIPPAAWQATLDEQARIVPAAAAGETVDQEIARCLGALATAFGPRSPHAAPPPAVGGEPASCPACGARGVRPLLVRRPALVYGRCAVCGHGVLLGDQDRGDPAVRAYNAGPGYYRTRDPDGVGYDDYAREAAYREAKGARLVDALVALAAPPVRSLLEVGCGYGFSRVAAERAGLRTGGVDVNAAACAEAARRYGLATFHGTLTEALAAGPPAAVERGDWDAVLYQFVLEHVVDPVRELGDARAALRPGGWLVLLVPSMDAVEIDVFGASYRSFRADHLHLYTAASLAALLDRARFRLERVQSHCNLHILRAVLSPAALDRIYASGRGPDLLVFAQSLP
jgi:SAM-dependent methyltransferase